MLVVNLVFTITEKRGAKPFTIRRRVDVPENWHALTEDEQREFLIKPRLSTQIHGQTLFTASRFQEIFCDPVFCFEFKERPNTASRPTAPCAPASDDPGESWRGGLCPDC